VKAHEGALNGNRKIATDRAPARAREALLAVGHTRAVTDVAVRRLDTQRLIGERFSSAVEAVGWLGAVQSQDFAGAKWALGQRTADATDGDLDRLFDGGAILRTHVLRPTWHFVLPTDIRWLQGLTAPRVKAMIAFYGRRLEVDAQLLKRSMTAIEMALRGGPHLTRTELGLALERSRIRLTGPQLGHVLMHAELDAFICSGPRKGKQFTYALLEERVLPGPRLDREEALAELTRRYFTGHGPAQPQDFAWWSGLTVADARRGLALVGAGLSEEVIDGKPHWFSPEFRPAARSGPSLHLLPNYDEFLVAYRDRSAALERVRDRDLVPFPYGSILGHVVVLKGQVLGFWKRRSEGRRVVVEVGLPDVLDSSGQAALERAAADLARFLGLPVTVQPLSRSAPLSP
jgi:Winged helix DNA-binding domain